MTPFKRKDLPWIIALAGAVVIIVIIVTLF